MDNCKYNPSRRLFLKNLGIVTAGIPILGSKAYAMLANRLMGAAGVGGETYISNGSHIDLSCTAAELAVWTNADTGPAVTQARTTTYPAGDPVADCWEMDTNGSDAGNDECTVYKDFASIGGVGASYVFSIKIYFQELTDSSCEVAVYNGSVQLALTFSTDGLTIYDGGSSNEIGTDIVSEGEWQEWTFYVHNFGTPANADVDVYLNDVLIQEDADCSFEDATNDGRIYISLKGNHADDRIAYYDYVKLGSDFD